MASAFFLTPEKKPPSATAPSTPTKTLPVGFRFPAGFSHREFTASGDDSSLIVLTRQGSPALYREFTSLNPEWGYRFSLIGGSIYFDDLVEGNESHIHEAAVEYIVGKFNDHGKSLGDMIGSENLFCISTGRRVDDVGTPDVASMVQSNGDVNEDPSIVVEVAFTVSLQDTHAKIMEYFRRVPSITAALIVYIPKILWRRLAGGMFNCMDGTMVVFYYERPPPTDGPMVVAALRAVSFGNDPLTPADYQRAREITGVPQATFHGHGVRVEDPPCTAMGQDLYTLRIPALHLLAHDVEGVMGDAVLEELRATAHEGILDLNIDLFALKRNIIVRGAHRMNRDRATVDNPRPALPPMYVRR